jgi:hypothetical protein
MGYSLISPEILKSCGPIPSFPVPGQSQGVERRYQLTAQARTIGFGASKMGVPQKHWFQYYPLVNVYITMERSTTFKFGKSTISMGNFQELF